MKNRKIQKKILTICLSTISCIVLLLSSCSSSIIHISSARTTGSDRTISPLVSYETKAWTWLFYDDADYGNLFDPLDDQYGNKPTFAEATYSSENLTVLVLQDRTDAPGKIWRINENHTKTLLKDLGEVNMGDPETLKGFIQYGKVNYPAERYLLTVYDHGGGWLGCCWDSSANNDSLTMHELHTALSDTGGVDIICFTAPCLMGSLESVYELRDDVDVYVGSEDLNGYGSWTYVINDICNILTNESSLSTLQIGEQIVNFIKNHNPTDQSITMSAIRTDKMTEIASAVNILCKELLKHWFLSSFKKVKTAHNLTFGLAQGYDRELYDFYNFTQYFNETPAAQTVQTTLSQAIIAEYHGNKEKGCHGLSIYFPGKIMKTGTTLLYCKQSYDLDFALDTHWNKFLVFYIFTALLFKKV
jgi:hypothetical protein